MNINQAKAVARIKDSTSGRAGMEAASERCKALIIQARKAGDDKRASELTEAWQVFKKRLRNAAYCDECGRVIDRDATRCTLHRVKTTKELPFGPVPEPIKRESSRRQNSNARVSGITFDSALAHCGFYTAPVQKVVRKWSRSLPAHALESYFRSLAMAHYSFRLYWHYLVVFHWVG